MTRRSAAEQAARTSRLAAILACGSCGPAGWLLGPDGTPVEPARRCEHGAAQPRMVRDVSEPLHERPVVP